MSDPITPQDKVNFYNTLTGAIVGGVLTIIGGFFATLVSSRIQKKNEVEFIKISLIDELHEINSIISRMIDTHKTAHPLPNSYLNDLQSNTDSFKHHKKRLFLIRNETLRRDTVSFYKNLSESIEDSINQVGKLGDTESDTTFDKIVTKFTGIQTQAAAIKLRIEKYKYYIIWFC